MSAGKPRIGILGAAGYVGGELARLLVGRTDLEVVFVSSESHAGLPIGRVNPGLRHAATGRNWVLAPLTEMPEVDVALACLPSGTLPERLSFVQQRGRLVVNLAGDYRLSDPEQLARHYPSSLTHRCTRAVVGIPEFVKELPREGLVNLPGCTAVAAFYAIYPLFKHALVHRWVVVDAKTGASGGGKDTREQPAERAHNVRAFKLHGHRHEPEIAELISHETGVTPELQFSVISLDLPRGIFLTAYARLVDGRSMLDVRKAFFNAYKDTHFVKYLPPGNGADAMPMLKTVLGTNFAEVGAAVDGNRVAVVACIDNLVKGAAGQAVQVTNRFLGIDETTGLTRLGVWP